MNTSYKLYRDGRFFDLQKDPFEDKPLALGGLSERAGAAARMLQAALDRYKDARPADVAAAGENLAKQKNAEGGRKKGGRKNK